MRLAIVGSRNYANRIAVESYVEKLPLGTIVVTGGWPGFAGGYNVVEPTRGVDRMAYAAAERRGLVTVIVSGSKTLAGDRAGLQRNPAIIDLSDAVVAFWDLRSRGTGDSLHRAVDTHKQVLVINPEGQSVPHWRQFLPAR